MDEKELRKFVREVAGETKCNIVVADFAVAVARKAVAAEREACAKVCEELRGIGTMSNGEDAAAEFAEAIRERSNAALTRATPNGGASG